MQLEWNISYVKRKLPTHIKNFRPLTILSGIKSFQREFLVNFETI